jgi:hypothetical protein
MDEEFIIKLFKTQQQNKIRENPPTSVPFYDCPNPPTDYLKSLKAHYKLLDTNEKKRFKYEELVNVPYVTHDSNYYFTDDNITYILHYLKENWGKQFKLDEYGVSSLYEYTQVYLQKQIIIVPSASDPKDKQTFMTENEQRLFRKKYAAFKDEETLLIAKANNIFQQIVTSTQNSSNAQEHIMRVLFDDEYVYKYGLEKQLKQIDADIPSYETQLTKTQSQLNDIKKQKEDEKKVVLSQNVIDSVAVIIRDLVKEIARLGAVIFQLNAKKEELNEVYDKLPNYTFVDINLFVIKSLAEISFISSIMKNKILQNKENTFYNEAYKLITEVEEYKKKLKYADDFYDNSKDRYTKDIENYKEALAKVSVRKTLLIWSLRTFFYNVKHTGCGSYLIPEKKEEKKEILRSPIVIPKIPIVTSTPPVTSTPLKKEEKKEEKKEAVVDLTKVPFKEIGFYAVYVNARGGVLIKKFNGVFNNEKLSDGDYPLYQLQGNSKYFLKHNTILLQYYINKYKKDKKLIALTIDDMEDITITKQDGSSVYINKLVSIPTPVIEINDKEDNCYIDLINLTTTCKNVKKIESFVKNIVDGDALDNELSKLYKLSDNNTNIERLDNLHRVIQNYFFIRVNEDVLAAKVQQNISKILPVYSASLTQNADVTSSVNKLLDVFNIKQDDQSEFLSNDSLEVHDDINESTNPILTIEQGNVKNEPLKDVQNEKFLKNVQEKKKHLKQGNDKFNNDLKQFNEEMENKRKETQKEIDELNAEIVKANSTKDIEEEEIILQGKDKRKKR